MALWLPAQTTWLSGCAAELDEAVATLIAGVRPRSSRCCSTTSCTAPSGGEQEDDDHGREHAEHLPLVQRRDRVVGDEQPGRPQADDDAHVEHGRARRSRARPVTSPTGLTSAAAATTTNATPPASRQRRSSRFLATHARTRGDAVLQVAAVVPGREREHDADDDEALARADEPSEQHVDELRHRLAAAAARSSRQPRRTPASRRRCR